MLTARAADCAARLAAVGLAAAGPAGELTAAAAAAATKAGSAAQRKLVAFLESPLAQLPPASPSASASRSSGPVGRLAQTPPADDPAMVVAPTPPRPPPPAKIRATKVRVNRGPVMVRSARLSPHILARFPCMKLCHYTDSLTGGLRRRWHYRCCGRQRLRCGLASPATPRFRSA